MFHVLKDHLLHQLAYLGTAGHGHTHSDEKQRLSTLCQSIDTVDGLARFINTELVESVKARVGTGYTKRSERDDYWLLLRSLLGGHPHSQRLDEGEQYAISPALKSSSEFSSLLIAIKTIIDNDPTHMIRVRQSLFDMYLLSKTPYALLTEFVAEQTVHSTATNTM